MAPKLFPAHEPAKVYAERWRLEMCRRDLKTTLGMEPLRCQSPAMARKEMLAFLMAHNHDTLCHGGSGPA